MRTATAAPRRAASTGAADRFAARMRSHRRHRRASIIAAVLVVVAVAYLVGLSPWLRVRSVQVVGVNRASEVQIEAVTNDQLDRPLALVDVRHVVDAVAAVPPVRRVDVSRRWPSTLRVTVHERVPVAVLPHGTDFQLVDAEGVVVESVPKRPADLPILEVDLSAAGAPAMQAALGVQQGLDPALAGSVRRLGATSPDGVWLVLANGARVAWGDDSRTAMKNDAALAVIRAQPTAAEYDVSAPGAPAVSARSLPVPLSLAAVPVPSPSSAPSSSG